MYVSRKASFLHVIFQRGCSLIYGLFVQASIRPAGPECIRERGSCLRAGLIALDSYRIVPAPV